MAAEYFFPFFHVVLSESAIVPKTQVNKDMSITVNRIFNQGQPLGAW